LKNRVGGTKDVDIDKVKALQPDLIIGNKEENEKSNIEQLKSIAPVWMSDIYTLKDSLEMMSKLGEILDVSIESDKIISEIESNFSQLSSQIAIREKKQTVLYLIWRKPFLAAGKNTFIDDMLSKCGFENFIKIERYPEVDFQYESSPDFIFLSSEPYPFKEIHIQELQVIYPNAKIRLVDGEMFSWYGSRLIESPNYFLKLIK
jgi:ABC-type Fe3+-hydroxamate transport system substrate-binding protein